MALRGPALFGKEPQVKKKKPPAPLPLIIPTATPLWGFFTLISCLPILSSWEGLSQDIPLCTKAPNSHQPLFPLSSFSHFLKFVLPRYFKTAKRMWMISGLWWFMLTCHIKGSFLFVVVVDFFYMHNKLIN